MALHRDSWIRLGVELLRVVLAFVAGIAGGGAV